MRIQPTRRASWRFRCIPTSWARRIALKYLRRVFEVIRKKPDVLFWTGAQIADWYLGAGPKAP